MIPSNLAIRHKRAVGFSLIEVLVSIAIFAVVAGVAYSTLDSYIAQRERLAQHYGKLERLQRMFIFLERDFQAAVNRTIRTDPGIENAIEVGSNSLIKLTVSETDFDSHFGASLKRIEWVLEGNELIRKVWDVLDTDGSYEPDELVIDEGIDSIELEFWLYDKTSGVKKDSRLNGRFPDGIAVKVVLESSEEYIRLFEVARS